MAAPAFGSLPAHRRQNWAFLIGSLVERVQEISGVSRCTTTVAVRTRQPTITSNSVSTWFPILPDGLSVRLTLHRSANQPPFNLELLDAIFSAYREARDHVMDVPYGGLTYYLFENLDELIVAIYMARLATFRWRKQVTEVDVSAFLDFLRKFSRARYEGRLPEIAISVSAKSKHSSGSEMDPVFWTTG